MTMVQQVEVGPDEAGMRLDRWFKAHYPSINHGGLQKLLRKGQVRVDGGRVKSNTRLEVGQMVRVPPLVKPRDYTDFEQRTQRMSDEDRDFIRDMVVFMDDAVIVLNKPSGIAVQGGTKTLRHIDGLLDGLIFDKSERPRLVHRLDKDTSGLLVLARSRPIAASMAKAFQTREVQKTYWALIEGVPKPMAGTIDMPLIKDGKPGSERVRRALRDEKGGLKAITDYAVIAEAGREYSWVALRPRTGRTHQLRVHMAEIGHPVVGDYKYGSEEEVDGGVLAPGLHLHARLLEFKHPVERGKMLGLDAELQNPIAATFESLGFDPRDARTFVLPWLEGA